MSHQNNYFCTILRIKYLLANGIKLLYCWQDTMCVLLNVIHAIQDILTSDLNRRTESGSAQKELDMAFILNLLLLKLGFFLRRDVW